MHLSTVTALILNVFHRNISIFKPYFAILRTVGLLGSSLCKLPTGTEDLCLGCPRQCLKERGAARAARGVLALWRMRGAAPGGILATPSPFPKPPGRSLSLREQRWIWRTCANGRSGRRATTARPSLWCAPGPAATSSPSPPTCGTRRSAVRTPPQNPPTPPPLPNPAVLSGSLGHSSSASRPRSLLQAGNGLGGFVSGFVQISPTWFTSSTRSIPGTSIPSTPATWKPSPAWNGISRVSSRPSQRSQNDRTGLGWKGPLRSPRSNPLL